MIDRNDDGDAFTEEGMDLEIDHARGRWPEDAEIVVAPKDTAHDLGSGALLEGEPDRRIALEEPCQPFGQPAGADCVEEGDADPPTLGGDGSLSLRDGVSEVVEDAFSPADEAPAGLGEADVAADSLEEQHPDFLLQPGHLSGYR